MPAIPNCGAGASASNISTAILSPRNASITISTLLRRGEASTGLPGWAIFLIVAAVLVFLIIAWPLCARLFIRRDTKTSKKTSSRHVASDARRELRRSGLLDPDGCRQGDHHRYYQRQRMVKDYRPQSTEEVELKQLGKEQERLEKNKTKVGRQQARQMKKEEKKVMLSKQGTFALKGVRIDYVDKSNREEQEAMWYMEELRREDEEEAARRGPI